MSHYRDYMERCRRDEESLANFNRMAYCIVIWFLVVTDWMVIQ